MDGEQNKDASHEVGDQHERSHFRSLSTKRFEEVGYAEVGCTRGADLRLDWRRAFLSLDDAASPCHSVGRPYKNKNKISDLVTALQNIQEKPTENTPVTGSYPTWTRWTKFVGLPIGDERALRRYSSSRHVYNSELPVKRMATVSVGDGDEEELGPVVNSTIRQLSCFSSGSIRVRVGKGIFWEAGDVYVWDW